MVKPDVLTNFKTNSNAVKAKEDLLVGRKITKIVTRFPNLECGFFAALLAYCTSVCKHLGITTGKIAWEFISTALKVDDPDGDPETVYFNAGKGKLDQHGKPENRSLCQICSLDLVRGMYDFLTRRPWLREIFKLVRANDIHGTRISRHPFNLREMMTAMSYNYKNDPQLVLNWLSLAFCGVFENCKNGEKMKDVFSPRQLKSGVARYCVEKSEWFDELVDESIKTIRRHTNWANKMVKAAERRSKTRSVFIPSIGKRVRVIEVFCDSFKTGAAGRGAGYQIVIQWNQDGHCQIHGGNISEKTDKTTTKYWVHLGKVAMELRRLEAVCSGQTIKPDQDWATNGSILFADETKIPWYLPEFLTSLYNGSMSSRDVPVTTIGRNKLLAAICKALAKCDAVVQVNNEDKKVVELEEAA